MWEMAIQLLHCDRRHTSVNQYTHAEKLLIKLLMSFLIKGVCIILNCANESYSPKGTISCWHIRDVGWCSSQLKILFEFHYIRIYCAWSNSCTLHQFKLAHPSNVEQKVPDFYCLSFAGTNTAPCRNSFNWDLSSTCDVRSDILNEWSMTCQCGL